MRTKTFAIRKVLLFPSEIQKLELEKLFFIVRHLTNHYNNKYNKINRCHGKPKPMTYATIGDQLVKDIDALGGAPPGTIGQAVHLPSQLLKPCLREIESLQRRASFNYNKPVKFLYPSDEQNIWLYDLTGLEISRESLIIPGEPRLLFRLEKNNIEGTVRLARINKAKDGTYELIALYESTSNVASEKDLRLSSVINQLRGVEESNHDRRNSFMRGRARRNDDVASKGFTFRRSIMFRMLQIQDPAAVLDDEESEELDTTIFEKEELCLR